IGHTKAAAGAASLIKVAMALYNKVLPPTLKVTQPVEPLRAADSPFYVNAEMRPWASRSDHPRRAAMSAFGFGGSNFHAVLEEHSAEKAAPDWDGSVEIVSLAADSPQEIVRQLNGIPLGDWPAFARFAEASRKSFHHDASHRLAFAAHRTVTDLPKLIEGARAAANAGTGHTPDGVHVGVGPALGKLAILFPGQGSQYVGMLRELACLFPEMVSLSKSDLIYPPTRFDAERKQADEAA